MGSSGASMVIKGIFLKTSEKTLTAQGIRLCYKVRKNMKPLDLSVSDEVLLKKRSIIESVIKALKTQTVLEHSRHRSFVNFQVNVVSALIAYQFLENRFLRCISLNFRETPTYPCFSNR